MLRVVLHRQEAQGPDGPQAKQGEQQRGAVEERVASAPSAVGGQEGNHAANILWGDSASPLVEPTEFGKRMGRGGVMRQVLTLFLGTFSTLLAIINPLEALPIYLKLLEGKSDEAHREVARRSCLYAMLLMFFFLLFGTLLLRVFGVPLSMVRIVGGIILMRIGFELFSPSASGGSMIAAGDKGDGAGDVAFVPLAMPIM